MVECWLIRHGQTDWNVEGRYQGQADLPLNEVGLAQADKVAEKMTGKNFDALYCSDLLRACQTAAPLSKSLSLEIKIDPRLREVNLGEWQGQLFTSIREQYPVEIALRRADPENSRPPGGETVRELAHRVWEFFDHMEKTHNGGKVIIVSHGLTLASVLARTSGKGLQNIFTLIPENAVPQVIIWDSKGPYPGPDRKFD